MSITAVVFCQDFALYQKRWLVQGGDTIPYRILLPNDFDPAKTYPIIFFLHGSGERGNDNESQLAHGGELFLKENNRKNFPAIVVFPQCAGNDYWSNVLRIQESNKKSSYFFLEAGPPTRAMQLLQSLVKYILNAYPVNINRVYVGGLSMGGMGTFELVRRSPGIFAAAFAICGGAHPATAKEMKNVAWWIFHGAKDDVVPSTFSEKMFIALKQEKATVKFSLFSDANHNSWDAAFDEPDLLRWIFSRHHNGH